MRSKSGKRDTNVSQNIASDPLLVLTAPVAPLRTPLQEYYNQTAQRYLDAEIEDLRQFHPEGEYRPLLTPSARRASARLVDPGAKLRRFGSQTKAIRVFSSDDPTRNALICARRAIRREVMHALKLHKRRGAGGGKPRRNWKSRIKC